MKKNTDQDPKFKVPNINWDFTSKRILTSEKVDGIKIKDLNRINELKIDKIHLVVDFLLYDYKKICLEPPTFY